MTIERALLYKRFHSLSVYKFTLSKAKWVNAHSSLFLHVVLHNTTGSRSFESIYKTAILLYGLKKKEPDKVSSYSSVCLISVFRGCLFKLLTVTVLCLSFLCGKIYKI